TPTESWLAPGGCPVWVAISGRLGTWPNFLEEAARQMAHDDIVRGGWQTLVASRNGGRLIHLPGPPPPKKEEGTKPQRYGGAPTGCFVFRSVASTSWSVDRGYAVLPAELAKHLIRGGHARSAKPDERLLFSVE